MGSMPDERCPWDSGSEEDEDEDWLYSSVSRYQHLLMCRHVPLLFLVLVLVLALVRGVRVLAVLVLVLVVGFVLVLVLVQHGHGLFSQNII